MPTSVVDLLDSEDAQVHFSERPQTVTLNKLERIKIESQCQFFSLNRSLVSSVTGTWAGGGAPEFPVWLYSSLRYVVDALVQVSLYFLTFGSYKEINHCDNLSPHSTVDNFSLSLLKRESFCFIHLMFHSSSCFLQLKSSKFTWYLYIYSQTYKIVWQRSIHAGIIASDPLMRSTFGPSRISFHVYRSSFFKFSSRCFHMYLSVAVSVSVSGMLL